MLEDSTEYTINEASSARINTVVYLIATSERAQGMEKASIGFSFNLQRTRSLIVAGSWTKS
jgi:hypothetical protein